MSKYNTLWEYVQKSGKESFQLTFEEIQEIAGIPIDHSFLKYKKELVEYGWQVGKISMKEQTVFFHKAGLTEVSSEIMKVPQEFFMTTIKEVSDKNFGIGGKTIDKVKEEYMKKHQ